MKANGLTWKLFMAIVLTDVADSVGQLFMKKGLTAIGMDTITLQNLAQFLGECGLSGMIWLGVVCYILNFFLWITILPKVDLSVAAPVGSTSYIFVPLLAIFFLGETVGILRWSGIALIILGIHLVSQSTGEKVLEAVAPEKAQVEA